MTAPWRFLWWLDDLGHVKDFTWKMDQLTDAWKDLNSVTCADTSTTAYVTAYQTNREAIRGGNMPRPNDDRDDARRQPTEVSGPVRNYLGMTRARDQRQRESRRDDWRGHLLYGALDNDGLDLDEGNDLA